MVIIGRDDSCDIILDDPAVSMRHVRVAKQGDSYSAEDLGSSNGTFFNDEPIVKPVPVKPGDRIKIGQTLLEFVG
jgi:pSer/pThr/pTyr-binding forkhead associated (FHA) protein